MADIMLVLLIIFMITTPLLQENVVVNLPKAQNPLDTQAKEPFVLSMTRDGRLYAGKTLITEQELILTLSERFAAEIDKTIFVRADQTLAYRMVVHIVDECRKAGVERIGLMADKEAQANVN